MVQIPRADPGFNCPFWKKPMETVCHKCAFWMHMRGKNGNTGEDVDNWGCAIAFLPMLLIENAQQTRGAAAATEDTRNEFVRIITHMAKFSETLIAQSQNHSQSALPGSGRSD